MRICIVVSSLTGNTRLLAEAMARLVPGTPVFTPKDSLPAADLYAVGFWTDKGACDDETARLLAELEGKKIFLFGTAGFGGSAPYFTDIITRTEKHVNPSCEIVGTFMCQGKMPPSVRARYVKLKESGAAVPNLDMLIENFDRALTHPDQDDLAAASEAFARVL